MKKPLFIIAMLFLIPNALATFSGSDDVSDIIRELRSSGKIDIIRQGHRKKVRIL